MKKYLFALFYLVWLSGTALAGDLSYIWQPGFRKQTVPNACFTLNSKIGETRACTAVPWIEDKKLDLSLNVGGAFANGQIPLWIPLGLGYNLTPQAKAGLLWVLDHAAPNSFANAKSLLSPSSTSGPDVEFNISLNWGWTVSGGKAIGELVGAVGPKILFN